MDEQRRRDRVIDQELSRALRRGPTTPAGEHLDAETLAAWMDRSLDNAAAARAEAHTADCASCQALVAALARTAPAPVPAGRTWWSHLRNPWLIPIAAGATALAIYVAVPSQPPTSPATAPAPSVSPAPSAAPAPATSAPAPAEEPAGAGRRQTVPAVAQPPAPEGRRALTFASAESKQESASSKIGAQAPLQKASAATAPPANAPRELDRAQGRLSAVDARAAQPRVPTASAPSVAGAREELARREAGATPLNQGAALRVTAAAPLRLVTAVDGQARWQVNGSTMTFLLRADSPGTPAVVPADVTALVAGSAPGGAVCWLVGRAGVVLVATDGSRFTRVSSPAPADLVAVQAADAQTATVTTADGRRFRTLDQGTTWMAVAP